MRFGVPRSPSPSPVRRQAPRKRSGFGVPRNRSESDDSDSESVASSSSASSVDSFAYESESQVPVPIKQKRQTPPQTAEEQYFREDTIASIRLRVKYRDAYEDWENQTRKDAFVTARQEQTASTAQRRRTQLQMQDNEDARLAAMHTRQMEEVEALLANFKMKQAQTEFSLKDKWDQRSKAVWSSVHGVIAAAEAKVLKKLEAEEAARKAEEEARQRLLQAKKAREDAARKAEEEKRQAEALKAQQEALKAQHEAEALRLRQEREAQEKAQEEERKKVGLATALEDWQRARDSLMKVKITAMRPVKADREKKAAFNVIRRQIVAKVGQLNSDSQRTNGIAGEIVAALQTTPPLPDDAYYALLSSMAKAIICQAEVEVTAEKRTAIPLAQLAVALLCKLQSFDQIFWAKLVQRTGGWAIPLVLPAQDIDGSDLNQDQAKRRKVMGYVSAEETNAEYTQRVAGIMRVYFHIIMSPHPQRLSTVFGAQMYWQYFARTLKEQQLLLSSVAAEILYVALDVGGAQARHIWGAQWVKMLGLLYAGTTEGFRGSKNHLVGGTQPEGIAARVRVQLEIERILAAPPT
ncbi:hypothetical protein EUX98_g3206 [Antrodiella citrinella]|uniref:mRNA export factor GLE1 n=1 Tax=Antrodiella citrinella TaxID=2447956 RepID=A0A4S4MX38_9APHY|nr:hypothetical protein EUX98_g3206 [Antrodiella citrinella]